MAGEWAIAGGSSDGERCGSSSCSVAGTIVAPNVVEAMFAGGGWSVFVLMAAVYFQGVYVDVVFEVVEVDVVDGTDINW